MLSFKFPEIQNSDIFRSVYIKLWRAAHLVEALRYKSEVRWFDSQPCHSLGTSTSWKSQGLPSPVQWLLYLYIKHYWKRPGFSDVCHEFYFGSSPHKILRYNASKLSFLFSCNTTRQSCCGTPADAQLWWWHFFFCYVAVSMRCQEAAGA